MSTYEGAKTELRNYVLAGVPLVLVRSGERNRVERMGRELAREGGLNVLCYTEARQVRAFGQRGEASPKDVSGDPLGFASDLFLRSRHVIFLLADTGMIERDSLYARELLGVVYAARETGNTVVAVAGEGVWAPLARLGLQVRLDFPDFNERARLARDFVDAQAPRVSWDDASINQLAALTRGLSELQITNLLRSSLVARGALGPDDVSVIVAEKRQLFAPVACVIPVIVRRDLIFAGLEGLRAWLDRKREVFFAPRERLEAFGLEAPKGVLLVGVPGCGKSFSARLVAARWGLPLFRFDLGSVYDKYVGESERQMREALNYIDNVAPCVLWVDEIEKALASTSSESDVGQRVLGQFLFWLQESPARVFLVATANDVTKLPPELFRKGRFSETFFVDVPNECERAEAIRLYVRSSLHIELSADDVAQLVRASAGFSYSDIEQSIKDVAEQVAFGHRELPDAAELAGHFRETLSITEASDTVDTIRAWGRKHARSASLEVAHE